MSSIPTHAHTQGRASAATVALAPVVILAAFLAHPFLAVLPDAGAVAAAVAENTTRWAVAHLLTAIGSALIALAFLAVRVHLRNAGEERFSPWGVPFVVFGSVLYAVLPGLEFAPLTAAETGGDIAAVQAALQPWFIPIFVTGAITFAIGIYAFARASSTARSSARAPHGSSSPGWRSWPPHAPSRSASSSSTCKASPESSRCGR